MADQTTGGTQTPAPGTIEAAQARNALRHGLRTGKLPSGCSYIRKQLTAVQREIEDAILAVRGEIDLTAAALIQTAVRWERHALLAGRWLSREAASMSHADRLSYSREIARASTERDKILGELGINRPADVLDAGKILSDLSKPTD